jgi:hypothetical protein
MKAMPLWLLIPLAFASPSHAWLVGLIMGLSIAGTYVVGKRLGHVPVYPIPHPVSTLIALVPAAIGAACGVAVRVGVRSLQGR